MIVKGYDWKPGWKYVHKRLLSPSKCRRGTYRSKNTKGVQVVVCKVGGKMRAQAIRIPVKKFKKTHPGVWKKLNKR